MLAKLGKLGEFFCQQKLGKLVEFQVSNNCVSQVQEACVIPPGLAPPHQP